MTTSWDRQAGETEEWYERFKLYLYMGPGRSIAAAHTFASHLAEAEILTQRGQGGQSFRATRAAYRELSSWRGAAGHYQWKKRAAAFDHDIARKGGTSSALVVHAAALTAPPAQDSGCAPTGEADIAGERDKASEAEIGDREEGGDSTGKAGRGGERLRMVAELLDQVYSVLRQADLATMSKEEARQLLPTFRLFFRDLLRLHQEEAAHALSEGEDAVSGMALRADDLAKLSSSESWQQMIADLRRAITERSGQSGAEEPSSEASWNRLRDLLAHLYPDEVSARRVAHEARLDVTRIHFAGRAIDQWQAILTEALNAGHVESLLAVAQSEYGGNAELAQAMYAFYQARWQMKKGEGRGWHERAGAG